MPNLSDMEYDAVVSVINAARYFLCAYPYGERHVVMQAEWDLRRAMATLGEIQAGLPEGDDPKEA